MKQCDIVLVPFPFSDQSGQKVRPALVLSNDKYNQGSQDLIACAVTSSIKPSKYSLVIDQHDIEDGILHEQSAIKVENVLKIQKSLILKRIATLKKSTFTKAVKILCELISPA